MARVMNLSQLPLDIRKQMMKFEPAKRRRVLRKIFGHVMHSQVIVRFLRGGYHRKGDWKSASADKKFNNRWSVPYVKRPSKDIVTPDKIRNVDTQTMGNSYRVLSADANSVTVGPMPSVMHPVTNTPITKIANREESIGNSITGFTEETMSALRTEWENWLDRVARGLPTPYLPKSRMGRRGATNLSGGL